MRTKHPCVSVRLVLLIIFKPSGIFADHSKAMLLQCGSFLLFMFHVYLSYAIVSVPCIIENT